MAGAVTQTFGILGAGSIGGYVGAHLVAAGVDTVLVGRERLGEEIRRSGLRATNLRGGEIRVEPDRVRYSTDVGALAGCDVVLVTLKSGATAAAARDLAGVLGAGATVVSLQNGVRNAAVLSAAMPGARVLAGMAPYNVVWSPDAHFHCGTSGALAIEDDGERAGDVVSALRRAGLEAYANPNLEGVLWGKLIFNLNNPINALAGAPLRDELADAGYRRILAAAQREALGVLGRCGIRPQRLGRMIPRVAPVMLSLPDVLFRRVAAGLLAVDPHARSSMWEDFERGRPTEIDYINGEIVTLAREHGLAAPVNEAIVGLVKEVEQRGGPSPRLSAPDLARRLGLLA